MESLRADVADSLKGVGSLFGGGARAGSRVRSLLVGAQVAMSLVLLAGAGLFVRAHYKLMTTDPGFETKQTLFVPIYTQGQAQENVSWNAVYRSVAQRVEVLPGIQSVAYASGEPFFLGQRTMAVGFPGQPRELLRPVLENSVSPRYFETLGIRVLHGRALKEADSTRGAAFTPVVVSDTLARTFWPTENPIGKRLRNTYGRILEVAGVARDVSSASYGDPDGPVLYMPWNPDARGYFLLARFSGDPRPIERAIVDVVRETAQHSLGPVRTIQARMDVAAARFWTFAECVLLLGGIAIVLAVIGIYGVVSFAATQRTKEMGIRVALGAQAQDVVWEIVSSGARSIVGGLLAGLPMALAGSAVLAKAMSNASFRLDTRDPIAYAAVSLLLVLAALAAMLVPARRAAKADPLTALRHE